MTSRRSSRGADLAARLARGRQQAARAARPGARQLPVVRGLTPKCQFSSPIENVLANAREILVESRTVYRHGSAIVVQVGQEPNRALVPLLTAFRIEPAASSLLANLFICELAPQRDDQLPIQFPPPQRFAEVLLNSAPTLEALPRIKFYATRPVFDHDFTVRGPGWHPDIRLLVHGPEVEPVLPDELPTTGPALDRLPPRLRQVLSDFCLRSDADIANTVGAMLTGLLVPMFVEPGKPLCLLDGNQPGVGETLLARIVGLILDGVDPRLIHYTPDDEELAKRLCANLKSGRESVVLIDNAKVRAGTSVSSPVIEANSMAPQISLRILGQSANFERPNDLLWFLTMNSTRTSADIVSRSLPIRFQYEGDPGRREFGGRDPLPTARRASAPNSAGALEL